MVFVFSTTLHDHTFQKTTIFGKSVNYEVHNLYTPRLILFIYLVIIYGVISNDLYHYLVLRTSYSGSCGFRSQLPSRLSWLNSLTVLLSTSRKVLVQYLKFGHDPFLPHARILYSSFTITLPIEAV